MPDNLRSHECRHSHLLIDENLAIDLLPAGMLDRTECQLRSSICLLGYLSDLRAVAPRSVLVLLGSLPTVSIASVLQFARRRRCDKAIADVLLRTTRLLKVPRRVPFSSHMQTIPVLRHTSARQW